MQVAIFTGSASGHRPVFAEGAARLARTLAEPESGSFMAAAMLA